MLPINRASGLYVTTTTTAATTTTTTTTNIKAAGAVDREYANLFFIRRPFVVLSWTCWAKSGNQQNEVGLWTSSWPCRWLVEGFDFVFSLLVHTHCTIIVQTLHRRCTDTVQNCTDTVQTLCKHGTLHKHCTATAQTLYRMAQTLKRHCANSVHSL